MEERSSRSSISCLLLECEYNEYTCVGRVQATYRNVYHRHLHGCSIPLWNIRPGHEFKGICTMIRREKGRVLGRQKGKEGGWEEERPM